MAAAKTEAPAPATAPPATQAAPAALVTSPPRVNPASLVPVGEHGIEIRSLDELLKFATMCVENGAAPKDMKPGAVAIAIQVGLERNLGLTGGLRFGQVINGMFSWNGKGVIALIENSPLIKKGSFKRWYEGDAVDAFKEGNAGDFKAVATAWRFGHEEPWRSEFSVKDARKAGLIPAKPESPWTKYQKRMLMWRAIGFLGTDLIPDELGGYPIEYELRDHPEMTARVVSPRSERPALPAPVDDPLSAFISGRKPAAEPIIEAEAVRQSSPVVGKREVLASEPEREPGEDEEPPFASHEEADRELAEQETKQRGLFEGR